MELMFTVSTFGDRPAGNILGQELAHIALDSKVSENTRNFVMNKFYVDDGLTSSASKQKLLNIKRELPGVVGIHLL